MSKSLNDLVTKSKATGNKLETTQFGSEPDKRLNPKRSSANKFRYWQGSLYKINKNVLFGLFKKTACKIQQLKLIVMSATLNALKFLEHFNEVPIL